MLNETVKISVEIDRNTDLDSLMINLRLVKSLVSDLEQGLAKEDLAELLVHNGLAGSNGSNRNIEGRKAVL